MEENFDLLVIGGGPGGYVCAIRGAQLGLKTACVESRGTLGGTCLNVGCIPSKALLHASEQYENNLKNTGNFDWGIEVDNVKLDLQKLMKKKLGIVEDLTKGINFLFNKNKIDRFIGEAKILKENKVKILANKKEEIIKAINLIFVK